MASRSLALKGLTITRSRLANLGGTYERHGGSRSSLGAVVSQEVLASTRKPECKCEDPKHMAALGLPVLRAGMLVRGPGGLQGVGPNYNYLTEEWEPVEEGTGLGSGCTTGRWVCPRLNEIRRRYGV
jgi:hypothetical protein